MHMRTILAIARKDTIDVVKNKQTLIAILTPIGMAIFFIFFQLLFNDKGSVKVYIYDPSHSHINQVATTLFDKPEIVYANSADDVTSAFGSDGSKKNTPYAMGLIVPDNFEESIHQGQQPQVTLYMDGNRMSGSEQQSAVGLIMQYTGKIAHPQAPVTLKQAVVNPPAEGASFDMNMLKSVYTCIMIMFSLYISMFLVPALLIEEKEKKTIRMLMVSPASFTDIVLGKTLVALSYQLILTLVVLIAMQGFVGNIPLLVLFIILGTGFTLALGLLFGSIFKTVTAASGIGSAIGGIFLTLPAMLAGPFGTYLLGNNGVGQYIKLLPTYYIADALYIAQLNLNKVNSILLDAGILCACIVVLYTLAIWLLRRQATVVAGI